MSLGLSRYFRGGLAVAVVVCGGLAMPAARAQDKPAAQEVEAKNPPARTQPAPVRPPLQKNGLLRLEEQLSRSFQFLKPSGSSLDGIPVAPMPQRPAAAPPSRRAKELMEEKKNWIFMNPDDLTALPKAEDLLNVPEYRPGGLDRKSLSPVERFYKDLDDRKAASAKKHGVLSEVEDLRQLRDDLRKADEADTIDPNTPQNLREKESALKKLLGIDTGTFTPEPVRRSFSDIFNSGNQQPTREEEQAQKNYIASFNQWLNRSTATGPSSGLALPAGAADPLRPTATPGASYGNFAPFNPSGRPANYDPTIGTVNPTLATATPQDITTKVLNQWNPYYVPPKPAAPAYQPPQPVFDVPRRKF